MNKIIYGITVPYVSAGFKRTYLKHLEVHELEHCPKTNRYECIKTHIFNKTQNKLIQKSDRKFAIISASSVKVNNAICKTVQNKCDDFMFFNNIETAWFTKVLLIQKMKASYIKRIKEYHEIMERNCPDVSKQEQEIKMKYPEYFI